METTGNSIHDLLDSIGLPWRSPLSELVARYGIHDDGPYQTEVVSIPTRPPLLSGLLRPIEADARRQFVSDLPSLDFAGQASQGGDAGFNIRFAADELRPALGATEVRKRGNVLCCSWASGRAALELTAWPPEWQDFRANAAHSRDPRLATACHVNVTTGFRPTPTPREQAWIATYSPVARIKLAHPAMTRSYNLEFLRDVDCPTALRGTVGWSKDRAALIFCDDELHIVAVEDVLGFEVARMLPAKGRGGSTLRVSCRSRYPGSPVKQLGLTHASGADDLNEMAEELAAVFGKPCEIEPYEYDA